MRGNDALAGGCFGGSETEGKGGRGRECLSGVLLWRGKEGEEVRGWVNSVLAWGRNEGEAGEEEEEEEGMFVSRRGGGRRKGRQGT